jgi:hypothetical protein
MASFFLQDAGTHVEAQEFRWSVRVTQQENIPAGRSKRLPSKAETSDAG